MSHKCFFCRVLAFFCLLLVILTGCKQQTNSESGSSDKVMVELTNYKNKAIDNLFSYVKNEMDENHYNENAYVSILDILQESIKDINAADNISNIDAITKESKEKIATFSTIEVIGAFYTLQEAFQNGLLTKLELQIIANQHNRGLSDLDLLDEELIDEIKVAWIRELSKNSNENFEFTEIDISLIKFYGIYSGSYIIMLDYGEGTAEYLPVDLEIDGVIFHFGHPRYIERLVVYKK